MLSGLVCALGVIRALAQVSWPSPSEYEKTTGKTIESLSEAPMFRKIVAAGELPVVEEKLPEEPLVIKPVQEIGQYGGTMTAFSIGERGYDDGKSVTSYLRKEMKEDNV